MKCGAYATITMSVKDLPDVLGWSGSCLSTYSGLLFPNQTQIGFKNISLTWRVLEVCEDKALINYTIMLFDAYYAERYMGRLKFISSIGDVQLLSTKVLVKLDTLDVYSESGTFIGRWPFWVNGHEVGSKVVMVHNVLTSDPVVFYKNGSIVITHLDAKVGLVDLSVSCQMFGKNPSSEGINTVFGFLSANRILGTTICVVPVGDGGYVPAGPHFPALYDKVSLIMIAYSSDYIDDVIRYLIGDIYNGIYLEHPLVISDSNIDFKLKEESSSAEASRFPFITFIAISIVAGAISGALYIWKKKRR
ncbi:MAG: hypothetical protein QHH17_06715 [Candidatus Bathyarchaeota archaeon]|jgi:hypothetical protein|nr:hypothetical protein [Candidatus Bathyarchaeota archaeon]